LTTDEAALLTPEAMLGGSDGWNPAAAVPIADGNREPASIAVDGAPLPDFDPATTE